MWNAVSWPVRRDMRHAGGSERDSEGHSQVTSTRTEKDIIETLKIPARYCGWYRLNPRRRWTNIVTADDETTALFQMLDATQGRDKIVLPLGCNPNDTPRALVESSDHR